MDTLEGTEFFERKVRPILVEHCLKCHGSDKKKGNLLLESRAGLLKGGDSGPAFNPSNPEKSLLVRAVRYTDDVLRMPPRSRLDDEQVAALTAWVRMGAPWPADPPRGAGNTAHPLFDLRERLRHWAWQPMKDPQLPKVVRADWPRSPIDRFILAGLEASGLAPAPEADRRTWLRRVTYDLIGLPPTPVEIDAFLHDETPAAYEKVVDRLLASPHYGERWARHWLDLVRYAETGGHEFDVDYPLAYRYRDYVIRAFNEDVPYDQFVLEHVAGDLLPRPRLHPVEGFNESILGTGFWFLGESIHSPVDVKADEAQRIDNQIDVFGKTFLGLTIACARCHDHKFDAITTKDYYALTGYLESSRFQRASFNMSTPRSQETGAISTELIRLRRQTQTAAKAQLAASLEYLLASVPSQHELLERLKRQAARPADLPGKPFTDFRKGSLDGWFATGDAFSIGSIHGVEIHAGTDPGHPAYTLFGPGGVDSGLISERLHGVLRSPTFVIQSKKIFYHVAGRQGRINVIVDGYQQIRNPIYGGLTLQIDHGDRLEWRAQDLSMWLGHRAYIELLDEGPGYLAVDQIRFGDGDLPPTVPNAVLAELSDNGAASSPRLNQLLRQIISQWRSNSLQNQPDATERIELLNALLRLVPASEVVQRSPTLAACLNQMAEWEARLPNPEYAMAMTDGTAWNESVYIRGNHQNLGAQVPRRFLEALGGSAATSQYSGRLELAQEMIAPSNPLLPRVLVNRLWQHHFGAGIVRSPDNFGVLGERPTHPELLDWVASEFIRRKWSIKAMHRLMVLSSTYRMASHVDAASEQRDPQNRLWHRLPVRRLEAECIRDALLAVSGRLDRRMYGHSIPPFLTPHMAGRGRPTVSGPLDGDGRRSLYLQVRRNFLTPLFLAFDYPIPFTTIGRRSVSNVPAQALALMNNPFVAQQAQRWGQLIAAEPSLTPEQRVIQAYVMAFGRQPAAAEIANAISFVDEQSRQYGLGGNGRAWADLAHVLVNVKEFIFLN